MDNNLLSIALYLHILTCITVLFYVWYKIIRIRQDSYDEYLKRKRLKYSMEDLGNDLKKFSLNFRDIKNRSPK